MVYSLVYKAALGLACHALATATFQDETAFMQMSPAKTHVRAGARSQHKMDRPAEGEEPEEPALDGNKMTPNPSMEPAECTDIANITMQKWIDMGYGFLFIHIPKNAGTTIESAFGILSERHVTAKMFQDCGLMEKNLTLFTSLRNPYDRAVSAYLMWLSMFLDSADNGFANFVEDLTVFERYKDRGGLAASDTRQVDCVRGYEYENLVHLHLRVAHLNDDWVRFQAEMHELYGVSLPDLPEQAVNVADPHPPWCYYYEDRALADAVLEYYMEDFIYMNLTTDISHFCGPAGSNSLSADSSGE